MPILQKKSTKIELSRHLKWPEFAILFAFTKKNYTFFRILLCLFVSSYATNTYSQNFQRQVDFTTCGPDVIQQVLTIRGVHRPKTYYYDLLDHLYPETINARKKIGSSLGEVESLISHEISSTEENCFPEGMAVKR